MESDKKLVKEFWNEASCGENLYLSGHDKMQQFQNQMEVRYKLEPYIIPFAAFDQQRGKKVLEIGVGLGADHQMFAKNGADLYGIDLTERAINHTRNRLELFGLQSTLRTGDAEQLPFENGVFDFVYSWGVIHHSPNTPVAVREIHRVLKPGGEARVMIYNTWSMVGLMLWIRYALLALRPFTSMREIYSKYLESPGTKAYTVKEAKYLFRDFKKLDIDTVLTHGDLLTSRAGQRHEGLFLDIARKIYPRLIIRSLFPKNGLFMLIRASK